MVPKQEWRSEEYWIQRNTELVSGNQNGFEFQSGAVEAMSESDGFDKSDVWDLALLTEAVFSLSFLLQDQYNQNKNGSMFLSRQSALFLSKLPSKP